MRGGVPGAEALEFRRARVMAVASRACHRFPRCCHRFLRCCHRFPRCQCRAGPRLKLWGIRRLGCRALQARRGGMRRKRGVDVSYLRQAVGVVTRLGCLRLCGHLRGSWPGSHGPRCSISIESSSVRVSQKLLAWRNRRAHRSDDGLRQDSVPRQRLPPVSCEKPSTTDSCRSLGRSTRTASQSAFRPRARQMRIGHAHSG